MSAGWLPGPNEQLTDVHLLWLIVFRIEALGHFFESEDVPLELRQRCHHSIGGLFKQIISGRRTGANINATAPARPPFEATDEEIASAAGQTALFTAVTRDVPSFVEMLLEAGAKPDGAQGPRRFIDDMHQLAVENIPPAAHEIHEIQVRHLRDLRHVASCCRRLGTRVSPLVAAMLTGNVRAISKLLPKLLPPPTRPHDECSSSRAGGMAGGKVGADDAWLILVGAILFENGAIVTTLLQTDEVCTEPSQS